MNRVVLPILLQLTLLSMPLGTVAQTPTVPRFRSIDEAIGWLKARGTCEQKGPDRGNQKCRIRIELPPDTVPETQGESIWDTWAWMELYDLHTFRNFTVTIVRSRFFALSSDPASRVRSGRVSTYHFDSRGLVSEVTIGFFLESSKGETVLSEEIPIPKEYPHKHGRGPSDFLLFNTHLGIGWNYGLPKLTQ
jgi:hypothetical protein